MRVVRIAAIVLAAGASQRLGELKQLIRLNGEAMVGRAARICREAGCDPVIVVLGFRAEKILEQCSFEGAELVLNEGWAEGMSAAVRKGINALEEDVDVDGCILMACDMPAVSVSHLQELMETGEKSASGYAGRRGVPAYFPRLMFSQLRDLRGDKGARELLKDARIVQLAGGELDVDTPEDLARVREWLEQKS